MKFKQLNLRKSFAATNLFISRLDTLSVGLLTEPYHYRNKISKVGPNFDLLPDITLPSPPRAAILAPKHLQATFLPHLSNADVAVAFFKQFNLLVVSGYCDIDLPMIQDWFSDIIEYASAKKYKLLIGIDSNAHSELYGQETNSRGELLEDFIFRHNLEVENRGTVPTFSTIRRGAEVSSFIDVTLSRGAEVVDWCVDDTFNNSDHNMLTFKVLTEEPQQKLIRPWKRANWTRFRRIIEKHEFHVPTVMSKKKLDKLVRDLYKILNRALNASCPLRPSKISESNLKWWNVKLHKESKKVGKQYRIAKRCKTLTEIIKLKLMKQNFKKLCRKEKRNAWRKFTLNIKETNRMAALARSLQQKERHKLYTLKNVDGSMTEPGQETLNLLFQTHFPSSTPLQQVTYHDISPEERVLFRSDYINQTHDYWLNLELLNSAMKKFNRKKSPGPDGIKPIVFDHLPDNFKKHLIFIYKCCIHLHYTPILWKDTKVIFIPKPGKDDYTLPKSFRPISLSNYFIKTLERLVCWMMDQSLLIYPIHQKQHGFLPGRSTESAISVTISYIEKYLASNQHCLAAFLDISAAFDSIHIDSVKSALLKHGGDPDTVGWYHNYLSHRNLFAELHQEEASCSTGVGFPQGGVCSAKFWLIAFNNAIKIINSGFVEGVGYADDCCILMGGTDQSHMVAQVQRTINKLITWGSTCGLRFNHSKTVVVLFTKSTKTFRRHIRIDGNDIPYSHQVKYLGLLLDSKLAWHPHIKQKALACKRFLYMVANITKDSFGPSPKIMRWTYLCVVRPMMTYGALCWAHHSEDSVIDTILRSLNRAGMKLYSSFPRSTPTRTLEIITDTIPLALQAQKVGLSARIRLRNVVLLTPDFPTSESAKKISHIKFWDQLIFDCNLEDYMAQDDSVTLRMPFTRFKVDTDSFSGLPKYLTPSYINVFTDGSKLHNKVGAGYYIHSVALPPLEGSFRLPDKSSVFQAEIFAINQAALTLQNLHKLFFIKIFVDSQAALLALNSKTVTSRLVADTVHNLNLVPAPIRLVWIKAHVGHEGNEKADQLAKEGTQLSTVSSVPLPKQATKAAIQEAIDEIWNYQWTQYHDGRQSKQFYPLPDRGKAKYCYNLNRQELGRLIRITTGHNNLFYHRSNVDKSRLTSPLCRFCSEERETFFHFATNCPCFRLSRFQFFNNDTFKKDDKWSVRQLLDFASIPSIDAALGGTFDPARHLEQQQLLEDGIESTQTNADLQPGRAHNPARPLHLISDSDSDLEDPAPPSQTAQIHDNINSARRLHPMSPSESSESPDDPEPVGPDAASRVTVSQVQSSQHTIFTENLSQLPDFQRIALNYETLDITDDEYLYNESDSN